MLLYTTLMLRSPSQRDHNSAYESQTPSAERSLSPLADFHIFQYFVSVVSTTYIDARRRVLDTNQYSVTDMSRETEHGKGVPGA